jgi:PBSX family phage terminase large subunit
MKFTLTAKHKDIINQLFSDDYDTILISSAVRTGKSYLGIFITLLYAMEKCPVGSMIAIASYSKIAISQNLDKYITKLAADLGIEISKSPIQGCVRLTNKNLHFVDLVYMMASNKSSWQGAQGKSLSYVFIDEAVLMDEEAFNQILARRDLYANFKVLITCNPRDKSHYIYKRFIEKPPARHLNLSLEMLDNPSMTEKDIDYYKRIYSGAFLRRYVYGEWVGSDNLIYEMFIPDVHIKNCKQITGKQFIATDSGYTDATTAVLITLANNHLYIQSEFNYRSNPAIGIPSLSPSQLAKLFKKWLIDNKSLNTRVFVDPAAKGWMLELKNHGVQVAKANNTVMETNSATNILLGIGLIQSLFSNNLISIDPSCKCTIDALYTYSWDPDRIDKPLHTGSDELDPIRYALNSNAVAVNRLLEYSIR